MTAHPFCQMLSASQQIALGGLVLGLLAPANSDADAAQVQAKEAAEAVASPSILWSSGPLPLPEEMAACPPPCATFTIGDVAHELIHDDVDYPHLFDLSRFTEAYAFQGTLESVTLIYASEDMAFRLVLADAGACTATVDVAACTAEQAIALVGHWKRECSSHATHQARDLIAALPKQEWTAALAEIADHFGCQMTRQRSVADVPATIVDLERACADGATLAPVESQIVLGICDVARKRHNLPIAAEAIPAGDGHFWDLRNVINTSEFPDGDEDRLYLRLPPFDVRLKRESEGLVVDIFAVEDTEPLASVHAFFADAKREPELAA